MIYIELFIGFLTVGLFSFGGAYAAIPLIRDVVLSYSWLDEEALTNMIAIAESTPGPIMVNLATYVGAQKAGMLGGIIATFAVTLPAFLIILLITVILRRFLEKNKYVQAILRGLKACITGIIAATGACMILKNVVPSLYKSTPNALPMIITFILAVMYFGSRLVLKNKISPILFIAFSAVLGVVVYGI